MSKCGLFWLSYFAGIAVGVVCGVVIGFLIK